MLFVCTSHTCLFISWLRRFEHFSHLDTNFWTKGKHFILLFFCCLVLFNKFQHVFMCWMKGKKCWMHIAKSSISYRKFQWFINYSVSTCLQYFDYYKRWASIDVIFIFGNVMEWTMTKMAVTSENKNSETVGCLYMYIDNAQFVLIVLTEKEIYVHTNCLLCWCCSMNDAKQMHAYFGHSRKTTRQQWHSRWRRDCICRFWFGSICK